MKFEEYIEKVYEKYGASFIQDAHCWIRDYGTNSPIIPPKFLSHNTDRAEWIRNNFSQWSASTCMAKLYVENVYSAIAFYNKSKKIEDIKDAQSYAFLVANMAVENLKDDFLRLHPTYHNDVEKFTVENLVQFMPTDIVSSSDDPNEKVREKTSFFSGENQKKDTAADKDIKDRYNKVAYEQVYIGEYVYFKPKPLNKVKQTKEMQVTLLVEMTQEEIEAEEKLREAMHTDATREELQEAMDIFKDL